jgi:predicted nucleotidyltransferase
MGYHARMDDILARLHVTDDQIAAFCQKWQIVRFELFGSVLRDDFQPESDVDVLVTFDSRANWTFRDDMAMEEDLVGLFGRPVDLVERRLVEKSPNWVRRRHILESARPIYAA